MGKNNRAGGVAPHDLRAKIRQAMISGKQFRLLLNKREEKAVLEPPFAHSTYTDNHPRIVVPAVAFLLMIAHYKAPFPNFLSRRGKSGKPASQLR